MSERPRVLVAAGSETLALRLRLMIEAEGGEAVALGEQAVDGVRLAVAVAALVTRVRAERPALPVVELAEDEDWARVRHRIAAAMAEPESEAELLASALVHARLLVVDDSVTYREYLRQNLTALGGAVTVCGDADGALAHLSADAWDGVLIDLVMPGLDGAQLCGRAARMRREGGRDYVLAMLSSREGAGDLIHSLEAGADLFLRKSQDFALIRAKLGALLRQRTLRR